jgi:hypothetical protein
MTTKIRSPMMADSPSRITSDVLHKNNSSYSCKIQIMFLYLAIKFAVKQSKWVAVSGKNAIEHFNFGMGGGGKCLETNHRRFKKIKLQRT